MAAIKPILKDPLTHFLVIGAVLFFIGSALKPPPQDEKQIVVDRPALLEFIQYRSKAFEPSTAAALFDSMSPAQRKDLIDDYVREEAIYREAKSMGLEASDYVIKQRLIQKFDFLAQNAVSDIAPSDEEVAAYFKAHRKDYYIQPSVTFTHVFFSKTNRGAEAARSAAESEAAKLNARKAPFEAAVGEGERFPFDVNYVERTYDYVESQFGADAAKAIFDPAGPFKVWRAPVVSPYGAHAVFVSKVTPGRYPALAEVRRQVAADAQRANEQAAEARIVADLVKRYKVVLDLSPTSEEAPAKAAGAK
ncbi:MAG: hypothetical protein GC153_01955 [Alphaproteobacteria bacterium]|nr:hypothetical protein [Alphaproteobacteria bacterium]